MFSVKIENCLKHLETSLLLRPIWLNLEFMILRITSFNGYWRCGASVVIAPSNLMIAGSNRTCAVIYKVSSCKRAIAKLNLKINIQFRVNNQKIF